MDKQLIEATLKKVKDNSPKKNFKQSIDLIINLRGLDLKKADHQLNMFVTLHHDTGKKVSVCALVGPYLESKAKEVCDEVILSDQFERFKKADIKKIANKHNFFIAEASVMPKIATVFGRILGPKGKMPNPKIGGVLPPNGDVKSLVTKLKRTVNLATKNEPTVKCMVGKEGTDNSIIDNILTVYNSTVQKLPNEKQNVKSVLLKLTMGPPFVVGKEEDKNKGKTAKPETKDKPQEQKETKQEKKTTEKGSKTEKSGKKDAKPINNNSK
jgi:large subunit ribosomal protein L1